MPKVLKPNKGKAFLYLRDYLAVLLDKNYSEIKEDVAHVLNKSVKSIEKYWCGVGSFDFWQAQAIVDLILGEGTFEYDYYENKKNNVKLEGKRYGALRYDEAHVLKNILIYFLKQHDTGKIGEKLGYEEIINKYYKSAVTLSETKSSGTKTASDLALDQLPKKDDIVQKDIINKIKCAIQAKQYVFFSGNSGSGKKRKVNSIINEYINTYDFKKFCIDFETDEMTYLNFLKKIETIFSRDSQELSQEKLERKAAEHLSHHRSIIFINGFDLFKDDNDRRNIIFFLKHDLKDENIVIITSNKSMSEYEYIKEPFSEVEDREYTENECMILMKSLKNDKPYCDAIKVYKKLYKLAYEKGDKNPSQMIYYLYEFSKQLVEEDLYNNFNIEANKFLFGEFLKDLDENSLIVLVTLSLFSNPIPKDTLFEISGLKDVSELTKTLGKLKKKLLIKVEDSESNDVLYSLLNKIKIAIEDEKQNHPEKYEQIISNWADYYIEISKDEKNELNSETGNIIRVWNYCEEVGRWDDVRVLEKRIW